MTAVVGLTRIVKIVAKSETCLAYLLAKRNQFSTCWGNSILFAIRKVSVSALAFYFLHQGMQGGMPVGDFKTDIPLGGSWRSLL